MITVTRGDNGVVYGVTGTIGSISSVPDNARSQPMPGYWVNE